MKTPKLSTLLIVALLVFGITFASVILARSAVQTPAGAPGTMTHQGYLVESGEPISGTVNLEFGLYSTSSGGSPLWEETHNTVQISGGYYTVLLGNTSPLDASLFSDPTRYLQVSVDTGSGFVDLPRQAITSVPFAFQAAVADQATEADQAAFADSATTASSADTAPWSGLTGIPAGFADGVDDVGGGVAYEHFITVSPSGGDFTSVADALNSISGSSSTERYLVWVGPGVYTETDLVSVPAYVHLKGSGVNATVIASSRTNSTPSNVAATVDLLEDSRISDLTVRNTGTGTFGIAIYSAQTTRDTRVDNVTAEVIGAGGTGHYAVYLNDAEINITNSLLQASGATGFGTGVNAGMGIVNIAGGFPQPLIEGSVLNGGNGNTLSCAGNSGTGFGIQGVNASPLVFNSVICGDHRGIFIGTAGNAHVHHSQVWVSTTGSAFLFETTASGAVVVTTSGVFYVGNKFTGTGGLVCTHNYKSNYTPASDGTTSGTACN